MALTLTKEDGSQVANANTYVTLAEAEAFFEAHLDKDAWDAATDTNKNIALVTATRILDQQWNWNGERTSPDTQPLMWPRDGMTESDRTVDTNEIPEAVQEAQILLAQEILSNSGAFQTRSHSAGGADQLAGINLGQGALKIDYADQSKGAASSNRYKTVVTPEIMQMLAPYGRFKQGSAMVKVHRG